MQPNEIRLINKVFVERNFYKERTAELSLSLDSLQVKCDKVIAAKNAAVRGAQSLVAIQNEIITNDSIALANYEKMQKKSDFKLKVVKVQRGVLFIGAVVLAVKLFL